MTKLARYRGLLLFAVLCLAACAGGGDRPREQRRPQVARPVPRPAAPAVSNSTYMTTAASIDLFIIGSSELALQRSSAGNVREFAQMMVAAHKGTSAQLSLAGRRLNLLPSATLQPQHQAMLDQLQSASDFDWNYRRMQLNIHEQGLALHRNYAARGQSPTLKPVAAAAVPIFERHLRLLKYL